MTAPLPLCSTVRSMSKSTLVVKACIRLSSANFSPARSDSLASKKSDGNSKCASLEKHLLHATRKGGQLFRRSQSCESSKITTLHSDTILLRHKTDTSGLQARFTQAYQKFERNRRGKKKKMETNDEFHGTPRR